MENQIVLIQNSQPVTSSLLVAERFRRDHKNILSKIDRLLQDSQLSARLNFKPGTYIDENNQERRMFYLDRDAFTFLVMGFTGRQATSFKLEYIDAFNRMEEHIRNRTEKAEVPAADHFFNKMMKGVPTIYSDNELHYQIRAFQLSVLGLPFPKTPRTLKRIHKIKGQSLVRFFGPTKIGQAMYVTREGLIHYLESARTPKAKQLLSMIQPSKQLAS